MIMTKADWAALEQMKESELVPAAFKLMQSAALAINASEPDDPEVLQIVPRISRLIQQKPELDKLREAVSALARATGLWNYIDKDNADNADRLLAESVTAQELDGITFHREQIEALNMLLAGQNLILSAPTSFGKSILIDALLASGKYRRVAIILPTIALLDEFRRRLFRRFQGNFELIMHPEEKAVGDHIIFLGTQERLLNRDDIGTLDLTVVDEFYKLDPRRKDERHVALNAAVNKLLRKSRQFFFLGPNISGVSTSDEGRWKFEFLRTRFSTVAVDTYDLSKISNKEARLYEELEEAQNWPSLVFVSSPDRANKLAGSAAEKFQASQTATDLADWMRENYGDKWPLAAAVEKGFAVHHARIPRALASQMVRFFNSKTLPVLFCTSTLIEGVNTAAKTVMLYDKKISRTNFDFFTFSNIKGRAGRLGEHHVGQVYLFNPPPNPEETKVEPTLFGNEESASDDYIVHLEEDGLSAATSGRISTISHKLGLSADELRTASSVGLELAARIREEVKVSLQRSNLLAWSGYPDYNQVQEVVRVICEVKSARDFGAYSYKQLVFLISSLRDAKDMKSFMTKYNSDFSGDADRYDGIFKFLRSCEYGLPQAFTLVSLFASKERVVVNYDFFVQELSRWFRNQALRSLDEEGIPIQISERFVKADDDKRSLSLRLQQAAQDGSELLSDFERDWLRYALDLKVD
jgi:late competence protein required for DNA uptake (superfamily II DNA/RNA helicase)